MKRKQTFNLARTAMLLLVMFCSLGAWADYLYLEIAPSDNTSATMKCGGDYYENPYYDETAMWKSGDYEWDGKGTIKTITVDASCQNVNYNNLCELFFDFTGLETINNIGNINTSNLQDMSRMFEGCSSLTTLDLSGWNTSKVIDMSRMFEGCSSLTTLNISGWDMSEVTNTISMFEGCSILASISFPESLKIISTGTFKNCTGLTSVTLYGPSCTLGDDAFEGCNNLANIYVYSDLVDDYQNAWSAYTNIIKAIPSVGGFCGTTGHESEVTWELALTSNSGVLTISGTGAMKDAAGEGMPWKDYVSNITTVIIENGVTSIGEDAFNGCSSLASVNIPASVTSIGNGSFSGCTSLRSVTIPASVTSIGAHAFYGCTHLLSVSVYASTPPALDLWAFEKCDKSLQFYVLKDYEGAYQTNWSSHSSSITGLTGGYCGATGHASDVVWVLTGASPNYTLTISGTGAMQDADFAHSYKMPWNSYKTDITTVVINEGVTSIGQKAFSQHENMTSITIANSVTTIGVQAFNLCKGLTSFTVPNGVTNIDMGAFDQCSNMETFHIGTRLATIDNSGIFPECTGLTTFTVNATNDHFKAEGGVLFSKDGTELVAYPAAKDATTYTIPNGVTTIRSYAFDKCTNLTEVTIPSSVATIGNGAFCNCTNLATINGHSGVKSVGLYAFHETAWLKGQPDGVGYINNMAIAYVFKGDNSDITIKEGTTTIAGVAFRGNPDITSVIIPASVTSIGDLAFDQCISLETITLNGGVTIGGAAFPTNANTTVTIASGLYLHNGTEPLSGTITDMTKLNGKTLQTTVPYTDDNGDEQTTTIDWATVNEGTQADPYMIYHPAQLLLLAYRVNGTHGETANDYSGKYFKLGANIAFSHEANEGDDYAENYEAIGRCDQVTDYNFKGDFDGDGHTVSGIRLRKTGDDYADQYQGLFGQISTGANIHDVHVTEARILGYNYVSGIVGYILFGTVSDCTVTETAITATYNNCYGTICGDINSGTLQHNYYRHCTVNGTPNATNVGYCVSDLTENDGAMPMYVAYIDANGDEQKCTDYTILDNTMTTISAGWYVVKSDVTFSGDLSNNASNSGEVNIILCDGATLTASKIDLIGNSDQLCIYGQSQGTGTANISGEIMAYCAISIYGGNITAEGIYVINGSLDLKGGTITAGTLAVNEGNINLAGATVKADNYGEPESDVTIATGITYYDGQGSGYNNGKLTDPTVLNGKKLRTYDYRTVSYVKADGTSATVDAIPLKGSTKDVTLGSDGATTWYVVNSDVNYKAITLKGNVNIILCDDKTMTSDGSSASAIRGNNNSLTIYGQTAGTGKLEAQSGEGTGISSRDITINGGNVSATASDNAIYASGNITINGGKVWAKGDSYGIKAGGNITLGWTNATDRIKASSYSGTVIVKDGHAFTYGGNYFYGTITDKSAIAGQTLQPAVPYIAANGNTAYCSGFFVIDDSMYPNSGIGWYVVNSNVTLNELRFTDDANIILCDGAKLTVKNNNVRGDITTPDYNYSSASINVYAQSAGTGAIEAGAIKTNSSNTIGASFTIYGGNVDINRLEAGSVYIYGGNITATTAENQTEAAILGNAETCIYGGSVTVTANGCNGIQSNQGIIQIYGGQVTATATGTGCYGISSVDNIQLGWTNATDFIQASSYNVGQNCDVYICDGQMISDGTTIYSDNLDDDQKDAIAGQKLEPYGFKIKANQHESDYWTTFYYGTANYSAPDGVTIYKAAIDGDHVQLTEVSGGIIRAGEAVILKATASNVTTDGYLILPPTTTDATGDYSGNELKGVDDDTWQEDGYTYYVLSKKGDNFGFFKLAKKDSQNLDIHLGAHKAYLEVASGNNAPAFYGFDDSDSEDGIDNVNVNENVNDNAIYDLSGRKVNSKFKIQNSKLKKGIYIVNGRKVLY